LLAAFPSLFFDRAVTGNNLSAGTLRQESIGHVVLLKTRCNAATFQEQYLGRLVEIIVVDVFIIIHQRAGG
jgi:hypothetical protein